MSLRLTNRLTNKQRKQLQDLGYYGTYNLSTTEAAELIDELFEEKRLLRILDEEDRREYIL